MTDNVFNSQLFAGKTVLVSGGNSGIGLEIARGFSRVGANVIATGSSERKLENCRKDPANQAIRFQQMDVSNAQQIENVFKDLPQLDVLVNAAGVARPEDEYDQDVFLQVMEVNLNSVMRISQIAMPKLLASQGSIVNVASMLSYLADASVPAYCASKSGITGLTRALAHRYGSQGVRVNAVAPGYHKTDMTEALWSDPAAAEHIRGRTALKRWGSADDLVGAVVFLSSSAAQYVTGVVLPVDGGYVSGF